MSVSLQDWAWVEVMFVKALVGTISSNFREVSLQYKNGEWNLKVTLMEENEDDREEAEDIVDEFSVYLEDIRDKISTEAYTKANSEIVINDGPLDFSSDPNNRTLFRRKEGVHGALST